MTPKLDLLQQFLLDSNSAGYATGEEKQWIKEENGSTTIPYSKGAFSSHDNFFGGEPYGGRLVVSLEGKPVWIMVYYGWVEQTANTNNVYATLRSALKEMPVEAPFRGPSELVLGSLRYTNQWTGGVERYQGTESIYEKDVLLYTATYLGGLVDQRNGV